MKLFSREFLRRVFLRDRIVLYSLLVALLLQAFTWGFLIWRVLPLQDQALMPLHYNIYFGIDLLGPWFGVFLPAGFGLAACMVNTLFIIFMYERQRLLAHFFAICTALIELILLVASFFMMLLHF